MILALPHRRTPTRLLPVVAVALVLSIGAVLPSYGLDLITFAGITGPLVGALTTLSTLTPAVKAIVAVVAFVVAFIALATLRNFSPALGYVGVAIFGSVGLVVAGAIMGAVI